MANRITIVTTRKGDGGMTRLGDGRRVRKSARRIAAIGAVDELNCSLGVLRSEALEPAADKLLARIQNDLFDLGAELAIPGHASFVQAHMDYLEAELAHWGAGLGPLQEFILPGGCRAAAWAHMARSTCRRAERALVALAEEEEVGALALQYLNRLSDLCFDLARVFNHAAGYTDVLWDRELSPRERRPRRDRGDD